MFNGWCVLLDCGYNSKNHWIGQSAGVSDSFSHTLICGAKLCQLQNKGASHHATGSICFLKSLIQLTSRLLSSSKRIIIRQHKSTLNVHWNGSSAVQLGCFVGCWSTRCAHICIECELERNWQHRQIHVTHAVGEWYVQSVHKPDIQMEFSNRKHPFRLHVLSSFINIREQEVIQSGRHTFSFSRRLKLLV